MKVHLVKALVERDPMEKIPVCVPVTALPILQLVHKGSVSDVLIQDDFFETEPEQEYERLEALYGERQGTGRSYAEEVYGGVAGMIRRMSVGDENHDAPAALGAADGDAGGMEDEPTEDPATLFGGDAGDEEPAPARGKRGRAVSLN